MVYSSARKKNMMNTQRKRCIALYSGGLDSILAIKIMQDQGIEVIPLYFCTPFFGFDAMRNPDDFAKNHQEKFKINPQIIDYTDDMIEILSNPRHGFGKHLNPCIDCKIGMLKRAQKLLECMDASFVITGEVLMQRPMSQRRQVMRNIEKESGLNDLLLRPLCAINLEETMPERLGTVNREQLWNLSGRGRKPQMDRAVAYGITKEDIPSPAGGCLLTYEQIAKKVKYTFDKHAPKLPARPDIMLDVIGRKFVFDDSTVLIVSRDEKENAILSSMKYQANTFLMIKDVPGPLCIVRGGLTQENLSLSAGICLRYGKAKGNSGHTAIYGNDPDAMVKTMDAPVFSEEFCKTFQD
jgi:tRNA-uridine 2-sulfurtransferase